MSLDGVRADIAQNKPFFVEKYRPMVGLAFAATILAAGATFAGPTETIRIIGMTVLTGVSYATAHNMIACRDCPQYFTVDHKYVGRDLEHRLIRTLHPTANALVWGPFSYWHVSAIAGLVLAAAARAPMFAIKISAASLTPYFIAGAVATFAFAHFSVFVKQEQIEIKRIQGGNRASNPGMPSWIRARWTACEIRNSVAFEAIAWGGTALAIGIIAARVL